ncbi:MULTISPECIES: PDDEXK nuclease domain-containing protein [Bacteroides]|jgi:predicted nuclease of restriction endonuclease-like (RecB) superfamily|uniref:PDDEXK nuclease domain-containing protein n=1 Tax=Bacteroides TaxID=816 RepID=UPI000E4CBB60|nr:MULTISPECIES: PDDEXK nuclease domain-containing protein [Bacteroides]QNL40925.1 DUF1016 domain-containing protein [Bacteroides sp. M10]RGR01631.1 DUF1016 domain-containing protein [Bacteroides sp. AF26-7BH]
MNSLKKSENTISSSPKEEKFFNEIREMLRNARLQTYTAINSIMTQTYWKIGKRIVEQEQEGKERANYGSFLIKKLSIALSEEFGQGLSMANLWNFRQFYLVFPEESILYTVCRELTWSHIRLIMRIDNALERDFYLKESHSQNWSVRLLERNIKSKYYQRIISTQEQAANVIIDPNTITDDFIKDPYILEFLGLSENSNYHESQLESEIVSHLQRFLLEMGKGFSFVARQMRISTETNHFYLDLVFYNYLLKCFIIIDLKTNKLTHQDIGQMDMYVRMFDDLKRGKDDNPTIGIILCTDKDETIVKYSVLNESKQIFASKYRTILPTEKELEQELIRNQRILKEKI